MIHRLLLLAQKELDEPVLGISKVKNGKWILTLPSGKWFLKQFIHRKKLLNQLKIVSLLKEHGFHETIAFHPLHEEKYIELDGKVFGIMEYIQPSSTPFSYRSWNERQLALQVLNRFHLKTSIFFKQLEKTLPKFDQIKKWDQRLQQFLKNLQYIEPLVPFDYFFPFINCSKKALEEIKKEHSWNRHLCIIHGDVANHNFILDQNGKLLIFDFDLIAIADKKYDDLQFANRILPYIDWKLEKLWEHDHFHPYRQDRSFYLHLLFQTDLFREWNRYIQSNTIEQKQIWDVLSYLTIDQFNKRKKFINSIETFLT
ncbi:aminoglycoside phosphotransferase (APT) family kinase protein [Oikeobacillus pervagus]|uniref:Aminoglycoside phosphotransferase (APT) family kinase protein n=1 Tax=Oikeobacillus pervagus TaxID=1325931 RepID=A0AAJ1WIF9_9BACI|nr:phosphotransferase [Oikeobacillus pervagus]MDQ0214575.1 aminoglycoside phosphotransferase (APT) family kinase protein [Oikeobacillus pervagus]